MALVHENFAKGLKSRLNGEYEAAAAGGGTLSPLRARQAGIAEEAVLAAAAESLDARFVAKLGSLPVSHDFLTRIPIAFARKHAVVGLAAENGTMPLAISDLAQLPHVEILAKLLGKRMEPLFAPRAEILLAINQAYQLPSGQAQRVIEQLDGDGVMKELHRIAGNEDLLDVADRAPVIRLVNLTLLEAVKQRASDVHVQPCEDKLVVRLRVDGVLHDSFQPPKSLLEEIISRIKVMGGMNIAERRLAQDGRATVEVGDRVVDLRISTLPTTFGEQAVIRLLDKSARLHEMSDLGMPPGILEPFRQLIWQDHGIVLVTGPTGSGKSTTLYAALQEINSRELNILTLEDPIEFRLAGISQTQVNDKKGMTFASGLRHVLRQDPDIIMVGEIRDSETAHMAIQSALTGHLVFSTLHTNDSAGAVARMLDLGVEPYLLASSLLGVLAQRLVRRICPQCKATLSPAEADIRRWGLSAGDLRDQPLHAGKGCPECLDTGYHERVGIFEILTINESIRELILQRAKASSIKSAARSCGMTTLRAEGIVKALAGMTTMDEVARVTSREEF